jgi:hypothetical protein
VLLKKIPALTGYAGIAAYSTIVGFFGVFVEVLAILYGQRSITPMLVIILGITLHCFAIIAFVKHGAKRYLKGMLPLALMQVYWLGSIVLSLAQWSIHLW